ncbi:ATPase [Aureococcus anophagefferens]|nr:ATPase [Aureococcus anophagefferens]
MCKADVAKAADVDVEYATCGGAVAPNDAAGLLSTLTYDYVRPLLKLGLQRPLMLDDLPPVATRDGIAPITARIAAAWDREAEGRGSLIAALVAAFARELREAFGCATLDVGLLVGQALILRPLIEALADAARVEAATWAAIFVGLNVFRCVFIHRMFYVNMRTGWNLKMGLTSLIHDALLETRAASIESRGLVYGLVTSDALRFEAIMPCSMAPWMATVALVFCAASLALELGWRAAVVGTGVCVSSAAAQMFLGKRFKRLRAQTATATDARIRLTSEAVGGARTLKSFAWQRPFVDAIGALRAAETAIIFKAQRLKAFAAGVYFATTPLAAFAAFAVFVYEESNKDAPLSVGKVSTVIAIVTILRTYCFMLGRFAMAWPEVVVACQRMGAFLRLSRGGGDAAASAAGDEVFARRGVRRGAAATALRDVSVTLRRGEVLMVVGAVGSGKSTFLDALLGELELASGTMTRAAGRVAYAPQAAWNVAGTVRENVVLGAPRGAPFDEGAYKAAVEAAALSDDVAEWPEGADTEIGERGISLSGGQAARLALARVCYACALAESSDPPAVALLDDPLSAVDSGVARQLVRRCVGDRLKGCAVVLCTHQLQFLAAATKVLVLDDDGTAPPARLAEIVARRRAAALVAVDGAEDALVAKEDRRTGAVQARTWRRFLLGGGAALFAVVVALFLAAQVLMFWADLYVLRWSRREDGQRRRRHLVWYGALSGSTVVLGVARAVLFFALTLRSSTRLHADALTKVLDMKLAWFDMNPLGRVLNRFSSDLAQVDELLSTGLLDFGMLVLIMLSVVVACLIALPYLALLLPVLAVVTRRASRECSVSMKELKRLDGQSRSPVLSAFTASLDGLAAVRAFGIQRAQQARLVEALELNSRAYFWWFVTNRRFGFVLDAICTAFLAAVVALAVALAGAVAPELPALALVYSLQLCGNFQYTLRLFAMAENFMTSVERLLAYGGLETERALEPAAPAAVPDDWPARGAVAFEDVSYRYRADHPRVLSGVTLAVPAGAKLGVCGRTGAGKSSLLSALSRLHELEGVLSFDGVDTATVPLQRLRRALSCIPQAPILFSGSLRFNVDPFGEHADDDLRNVVALASLGDKAASLDAAVAEGGENWSVGERQLLCLARAATLRRSIVAIDEATANIDHATDARIQTMLRTHGAFRDATILTVAHRIRTIRDSDLVVVLAKGAVAEVGPPEDLIAARGKFYDMLQASAEA